MQRKFLEKWLRETYAMEKASVEFLQGQLKYFTEYPEAQVKIQEHINVSEAHGKNIGFCLYMLGLKPMAFKDEVHHFIGHLTNLTHTLEKDRPLKILMAVCAFETMEIAAYRALISVAYVLGEKDIHGICERILQEESEMAFWCEAYGASVARYILEHQHMATV